LAPEVAPFPVGLNDCVSGVKWLHESAGPVGIDARRVVVTGESGGGNLTLATGMWGHDDDVHPSAPSGHHPLVEGSPLEASWASAPWG
jgi:acetyl esterase/lipase